MKPFSDTNLKASIAKTIRESNKISELIQSHVVAIKRSEKISDRNAIAKAFLADDIVPVVLAELPVEIQNVPRAEEFIKDTLKDISECVKLLYNDKEFRR